MILYVAPTMIRISLVLLILLVNRVISAQININVLNLEQQERRENDLALQIRQIQTTSEAPPAASGNNLSAAQPLSENPRETLAIDAGEHEKGANNKTGTKGNDQFVTPLDENKTTGKSKSSKNNNLNALALVWDGCLENTSKDNSRYIIPAQNDMENEKVFIKEENERLLLPISWNKRNANVSEVALAGLDKHVFMNQELRQQKEPAIIKKVTEYASTSTVSTIPITKEILTDQTSNTSEDNYETESDSNDIQVRPGQAEDWFEFEVQGRTKIRFGGLPRTDNYLIPRLGLEGGFHPFAFMSQFFSLIYPFEFPLDCALSRGSDPFKPSVQTPCPKRQRAKIPCQELMFSSYSPPRLDSIKVESTFLGFIIAFSCIALVIPSYLFILCILSLMTRSHCDDTTETGTLFPEAEGSDCNDRVVVVVTLFVVLLCCLLISGMAVSSEQASLAASSARDAVSGACADLVTWVGAAARELHHSIVPPVDLVVQAFRDDLRNVETLLGEPIQQAIASESGINLVIDSLKDVINESEDLSFKISALRDLSIRAGSLASSATEKVKDLSRQLENLKKNCNFKDAPLCDTINTNSLQISMRFDLILREHRLLDLRSLGVENLTRSISTAKQQFQGLPSAVATQTADIREAILRDVETRGQEVHSSSRVLNDIARHLSVTLHTGMRKLEPSLIRLQSYEFWRWSFMLGCVVFFGFVMLMMLLAMICGCGQARIHAKRTLQLWTVWVFIASIVLWAMICILFLTAGHAEVFICRALWDSPNYKVLSALLDRPSPFLTNEEGIFDAVFRDLENVTIDVSITDVLRDCERNQPVYSVFRLDSVIDVNKETSYFEWTELETEFTKLCSNIDVGFLKTLSVYFNKLLSEMLVISDVNLASYRMDYNGPIVGKDLPSLAEQLDNVAAQVTDLTTAGRLETLATRTQRLHITGIKPLEQLRADLVFKLTELELKLMPFRRKLNISLSHIHTAQFYIDNQGDDIAQKKASMFVSRLVSHAADWRTHVLEVIEKYAGKCGPLFDVYSGLRGLLCSRYVASLHGWWVCGFFLGLQWCIALTPLCVKLWRVYGRKIAADDDDTLALAHLHSCQQSTPNTAICENSNWNTPGPPPPPRSDSW